MKLVLWFSPLPPAKTDIANYTLRLAPFLREYFELRFCVPDKYFDTSFPDAIAIGSLTEKEVNQADLCIYHLGNNALFHSQIYEWSIRHPGLVVLHDRSIHEFLLGYLDVWDGDTYEQKIKKYLQEMARWYGESGYLAAGSILEGSLTPTDFSQPYPLFELACENSLAVLCHNPEVSSEIRDRFPLLDVIDLPLPYPTPKALHVSVRKEQHEKIRLVTFGFMGSNRRLMPFINAWSESPWRSMFTLDLAGEISESEKFAQEIEKHGLVEQISIHGFVNDETLDELLRSSDMAINLRYPSMGEASGSQLRIWANGVASAVTDTAWYSQIPRDAAIKIDPKNEHNGILNMLANLARRNIDLDALANAGLQQIKLHAPNKYVEELANWYTKEDESLRKNWFLRQQIKLLAAKHAEFFPTDECLSVPAYLLSLGK